MSSYVNPAARASQPLQVSPVSEIGRTSQGAPQQVRTPAPASSDAERAASAPRGNSIAINQVLLNAESLIASIMGLPSSEVSVSVSLGRYEF